MKEIQLTQGKVAIVDDEDFEAISAFKWYAQKSRHTYYAVRAIRRTDGGQTAEKMHRVILARKLGRAIAAGLLPDHKNSDGLDNRRGNLFEATRGQNARRCERHSQNPSSLYLGVSWCKAANKWKAEIRVAYKSIYLGVHTTELAAACAIEDFIVHRPELNARSRFMGQGASE